MLSDEELLYLNKQGFIAGPAETEEEFLLRIKQCQDQSEIPKDEKGAPLLYEACRFTEELADFSPKWVPLLLSKERLLPWQGGVAVIYQMELTSPRAAFLQIRPKGALFNPPLEIAKHELVHVARMQFDEPRFEEMLAYMTARRSIPRLFGALARSPLGVNLFVLTLILLLFIDAIALIAAPDLYFSLLPLKLIPLIMVFISGVKLLRDRRLLNQTLSHLKSVASTEKNARAILFRLTDEEIVSFSRLSADEILAFAEKKNDLRWRQIYPYLRR